MITNFVTGPVVWVFTAEAGECNLQTISGILGTVIFTKIKDVMKAIVGKSFDYVNQH